MASFHKPNYIGSLRATAVAIAAYKAVVFSGEDVAIAGAGVDAVGFTQDGGVAASGVVELATSGGGALATAGGAISAGDRLKVDANGDLVVASVANDLSVARAMEDAVDDDVFSVFVEALRIHA